MKRTVNVRFPPLADFGAQASARGASKRSARSRTICSNSRRYSSLVRVLRTMSCSRCAWPHAVNLGVSIDQSANVRAVIPCGRRLPSRGDVDLSRDLRAGYLAASRSLPEAARACPARMVVTVFARRRSRSTGRPPWAGHAALRLPEPHPRRSWRPSSPASCPPGQKFSPAPSQPPSAPRRRHADAGPIKP